MCVEKWENWGKKKERGKTTRRLDSDTKRVYVDEKYMKAFAGCEFEIIDSDKPIIAHFHWVITGVVMPVRELKPW